jgi:hypothetical protein
LFIGVVLSLHSAMCALSSLLILNAHTSAAPLQEEPEVKLQVMPRPKVSSPAKLL